MSSLSLSLNIPGYPKSNGTVKAFFEECLNDLKYFLKANLVFIIEEESIEGCDAAGDFYFVPCSPGNLSLIAIKGFCEDFEQNHQLGRFIDVDLNDPDGNTLSSGKSKLCFFCLERPAIECRRENTHEPEELRAFMFPRMESYCHGKRESRIIKKLSSLAQKALLHEISLSPKPGLVDKFSNGCHADMNYQTFINSTAAISPYFGELVLEGFAFPVQDLTKALPLIRNIGLSMESAMNEATQNINTQKGIIFLMGLSLFACGKLLSSNDYFNAEKFRSIIRHITRDIVMRELVDSKRVAKSHGEEIFHNYGFSGARGEAEGGFNMVFEYGLPQLNGFTNLNDEIITKSFLAIASNNLDTNILFRSGPEVLNNFKQLCKYALDDFNDRNYSAVIDFCKKENISPGGSADLLAVTIFVYEVMKNNWL